MKLPTGDSAFFPSYFRTERGKSLVIEPISLTKDHELRYRIDSALERGPGLSIALGLAPDLYKVMVIALTPAAEQMIDIAAFIFDLTPEEVGEKLSLAEIIEVIMSCVYEATETTDQDRVNDGDIWTFARIIDFFGKEYGWTIPEIMNMSRHQLKTVLNAVEERMADEEKAMEESRSGNDGTHATAEERMNSGKLLRKVKGKAHRRTGLKMEQDVHPSADPDWTKSEGVNSLRMFAHVTGTPIKIQKEGRV